MLGKKSDYTYEKEFISLIEEKVRKGDYVFDPKLSKHLKNIYKNLKTEQENGLDSKQVSIKQKIISDAQNNIKSSVDKLIILIKEEQANKQEDSSLRLQDCLIIIIRHLEELIPIAKFIAQRDKNSTVKIPISNSEDQIDWLERIDGLIHSRDYFKNWMGSNEIISNNTRPLFVYLQFSVTHSQYIHDWWTEALKNNTLTITSHTEKKVK